jgi:tryptophan synthase beta chain
VRFARTEGILPGPEPSHALRAVAEELAALEAGEARTILVNLSGHGHFDTSTYDAYFAGRLEDVELPQERIDGALAELPRVGASESR